MDPSDRDGRIAPKQSVAAWPILSVQGGLPKGSGPEDSLRGGEGHGAFEESCSSTACAAVMRAAIGKFLFASITMPIFFSGTKAT